MLLLIEFWKMLSLMCYYILSTVVECCKFLKTFPVICSFSNLSITVLGGADSIENVNYVDGHFHIVHCHKFSWRLFVSQLETYLCHI